MAAPSKPPIIASNKASIISARRTVVPLKPKALSVEYIDPKMIKEEYYHQNINNILHSDLYKLLTNHEYHFVNWLHSDLIFVSNEVFTGKTEIINV